MAGKIQTVVTKFPQLELELHRRFARDERFRAVCMDYEEAAAALRYWQAAPAERQNRVAEYASFLAELESEIRTLLEHPAGTEPSPHPEAPRTDRPAETSTDGV